MRDAFPPPIVVVRGIVYVFCLGGLRVNGILFVWDCVEKYYGAW